MTKKRSTRPNLSQSALERARAELRGEAADVSVTDSNGAARTYAAVGAKPKIAARSSTAAPAVRRVPTQEELRREYTYVIRDLRNLLILSGALLAAIFVIALLVPPVAG